MALAPRGAQVYRGARAQVYSALFVNDEEEEEEFLSRPKRQNARFLGGKIMAV